MAYVKGVNDAEEPNRVQKVLEQYNYKPGVGFMKPTAVSEDAPVARQSVNSSNNSTVANSNDSLNTGNVNTAQAAGAGGAGALVQASGKGGQSQGGDQRQGRDSSAHRESTNFSAVATAKARMHPNQVSFDQKSVSPEDRKLSEMRGRVSSQYKQRFGVELNAESLAVLNKMTDADELQSALKVMAQAKRSDIDEPSAFRQTMLAARTDSFQVIDPKAQGLA